jgi:hypothetical protein
MVRKKDKITVSLLDFYLSSRNALEFQCNSATISTEYDVHNSSSRG